MRWKSATYWKKISEVNSIFKGKLYLLQLVSLILCIAFKIKLGKPNICKVELGFFFHNLLNLFHELVSKNWRVISLEKTFHYIKMLFRFYSLSFDEF